MCVSGRPHDGYVGFTRTSSRPGNLVVVKNFTSSRALEPDRRLLHEGGHVADSIGRDVPWFGRLSNATRAMVGSPQFTGLVLFLVVAWVVSGPFVDYSRAWELSATAGAPICALILLVVFQHTQNRDDMAMQLKLDEMIRASEASDALIGIEDSPEEELSRLLSDYRTHAGHGVPRGGAPDFERPGRRERRQFAKGDVGPDRSFIFRSPEGGLRVGAQNLRLFTLLATSVDDDTWLDHLHRGDYSRWFAEVIGDDALTRIAVDLERNEALSAEESRRAIIKTIAQRYPLSA